MTIPGGPHFTGEETEAQGLVQVTQSVSGEAVVVQEELLKSGPVYSRAERYSLALLKLY